MKHVRSKKQTRKSSKWIHGFSNFALVHLLLTLKKLVCKHICPMESYSPSQAFVLDLTQSLETAINNRVHGHNALTSSYFIFLFFFAALIKSLECLCDHMLKFWKSNHFLQENNDDDIVENMKCSLMLGGIMSDASLNFSHLCFKIFHISPPKTKFWPTLLEMKGWVINEAVQLSMKRYIFHMGHNSGPVTKPTSYKKILKEGSYFNLNSSTLN